MTGRAHLAFALALHRAMAPGPTSDACFSPLSVAAALRLVATGASGMTRDELVAAMLGEKSGDLGALGRLLGAATRLEPAGPDGEDRVLAVVTTLWVDEAVPIREAFRAEVGDARPAPFQAEPDRARQLINAAVADTTRDLIRDLVPPGAITPATVAALVNALYLKCAWLHPFAEHGTEPRPFHAPDGPVEVATMELTASIGYAATGGWRVAGLPAAGGVRAVVLLPDGDLAGAEPGLTADALARLLDALRPTQVRLRLPKVDLTAGADLTGPLTGLGVRTVFTADADLRRISPAPLAVQSVLHQAVLRLDEQGLEGAAATAVLFMVTGMRLEAPVRLDVDRPFLLLIQHVATGVIYFMARVVTPG